MAKRVITEYDVRTALAAGRTTIAFPAGSIVTPLARDFAAMKGVSLVCGPEPGAEEPPAADGPAQWTRIAIGADHRGFAMKRRLIETLGRRLEIVDFGTNSEASCGYPEFAFAVARAVGTHTANAGIVIDGTGTGSAIVANKVRGAYAVNGADPLTVRSARAHNDANILTLGSGIIAPDYAESLVDIFLATAFDGGRHAERIAMIRDIEERSFRG